MPTYRFQSVTHPATKSAPCTVCGKKVRRQRTFQQTVNPFNKNAAGQPKTVTEILGELEDAAEAWQAEPETHPKCATAAS